eukprot:2724206-Rhodomonas_salina.1
MHAQLSLPCLEAPIATVPPEKFAFAMLHPSASRLPEKLHEQPSCPEALTDTTGPGNNQMTDDLNTNPKSGTGTKADKPDQSSLQKPSPFWCGAEQRLFAWKLASYAREGVKSDSVYLRWGSCTSVEHLTVPPRRWIEVQLIPEIYWSVYSKTWMERSGARTRRSCGSGSMQQAPASQA